MIKPIDEIPQSVQSKAKSNRQKIRNDIQEALDHGISKFEFVGDYNFKYLHQYAREEADRFWRKMFRDITLPHYPEWKEKYKQKYIFLSERNLRKYNPIIISSIKGEKAGEKRVFCEILDREKLEKECLAECEKILEGHLKMDEEEAEKEKRKKLKMEADDETESFEFTEELLP